MSTPTGIEFPPVSELIIDALKAAFPYRVPRLLDSEREIFLSVGQQEVIERLISIRKQQMGG